MELKMIFCNLLEKTRRNYDCKKCNHHFNKGCNFNAIYELITSREGLHCVVSDIASLNSKEEFIYYSFGNVIRNYFDHINMEIPDGIIENSELLASWFWDETEEQA
jgi:hypothetical protein